MKANNGFLCEDGDCLRNAFLVVMGENFAGHLPQIKTGYSLGMLAASLADTGLEFEMLHTSFFIDQKVVKFNWDRLGRVVNEKHPNSQNAFFCAGINKKGQPHGWAIVVDTARRKTYLIDTAKEGVQELSRSELKSLFAYTTQIATITRRGEFMPNTGANFVKNKGDFAFLI